MSKAALQLAYHLWINCIFYHPHRMLYTHSVTNLLPNFIPIYQWHSRWSKRQDSWCIGWKVSPKRSCHPVPGNVTAGNLRCNQIKTRSYYIMMCPNPMTDVVIRGKFEHRNPQRQRQESCCHKPRKTKDCQPPPDARRGNKVFFSRALGGSLALLTP